MGTGHFIKPRLDRNVQQVEGLFQLRAPILQPTENYNIPPLQDVSLFKMISSTKGAICNELPNAPYLCSFSLFSGYYIGALVDLKSLHAAIQRILYQYLTAFDGATIMYIRLENFSELRGFETPKFLGPSLPSSG